MANKKATEAPHYERRFLEAKSEMLRDAGPIIDFFISMHEQCIAVATKHNINPVKLTNWVLDQLPINEICENDVDVDGDEAMADEEDAD